MNEAEHRELLTLDEVCRLCSVSISTGRRWVRRGLLPSVVLPTANLRFRLADVTAFVEQHRDHHPDPGVVHLGVNCDMPVVAGGDDA